MKFPTMEETDEFIATIHQAQFKDLPEGYKNLTAEERKQINENPKASPYMPKQEPGMKDSNALPYHMIVDGHFDKEKKSYQLSFEARDHVFGSKTQGVPYIVYAPGSYKKAGSD